MHNTAIRWVLLYRTPDHWRISVNQLPGTIAADALPDTAPDAPIEIARRDLSQHLRRHWNLTGQLRWRRIGSDQWAAQPFRTPPRRRATP
jgi:hypothetical protein